MLTTEQTLTRVLQIVHALDESDAAIYNAVSKAPNEWRNAVGPIPQLYFLEQDLRRDLAEQTAALNGIQRSGAQFTLKDFFRRHLIDRYQKICLMEPVDKNDSETSWMKTVWYGTFQDIPYSYVPRAVQKIFAPKSDSKRYEQTLFIVLGDEL